MGLSLAKLDIAKLGIRFLELSGSLVAALFDQLV
jgi:hypothetical protein